MTDARQDSATGIRLDHASVTLTGKTILHDISVTLTEPRIGIIGRNGSGKSTLLRLMAGLIAPSSGSITVEGHDPARDRRFMLTALGILFQNPDHQILFPTVAEELAFGLTQMGRAKKEAAAEVEALLAREGRAHWAGVSTQALSQGQRHYLALLSVLAMAPRILLLDEPYAGLDLPTQLRLDRRLAGLPQQLITISHDPATMRQADRVLWLEGGRIRRDGPPGEVTAEFEVEMRRLGEQDADIDLPA